MNEKNVRLVSVELLNYKNVTQGKLEMPCAANRDFSCDRSEILGIYGQNGSGKTAVIEALSLVKCLLSGQSLPPEAKDGIAKNAEEAVCTISFFIGDENKGFLVKYQFTLRRTVCDETVSVYVSEEKISYQTLTMRAYKTLLHYNADQKSNFLSPKFRYTAIAKNEENAIELAVAKKLSIRAKTSFLFSKDTLAFLHCAAKGENTDDLALKTVLNMLPRYASQGFFVVDSNHSGTISLGASMPLALQIDDDDQTPERMLLSLTEPSVQSLPVYDFVKRSVCSINCVLHVLIPGMTLSVKEYGGQVTPDGKDGMRFEILSVRGETRIPLKCESEGIKKLISVLNILIAMYNHPSVLVAVDEFDAGVYEYLLGEILGILEENGRGQLIFTSHNLRPLEMINKKDIIFTTTNPNNRYIRFSGAKGNLRDQYIRSIHIGGQKEELYGYSNPLEIARAFRLAGKIRADEPKTEEKK
ncbi:MAG: ATP-binding protein [Clostridia bacterium]|nr:ATP-binding protein [Clostridia bacterium]